VLRFPLRSRLGWPITALSLTLIAAAPSDAEAPQLKRADSDRYCISIFGNGYVAGAIRADALLHSVA
jgi:hypothetical protein